MDLVSKLKKHGISGAFTAISDRIFHTQVMKFHYLKTTIDFEFLQHKLQDFDLNFKELTYDDFLLGYKSVFCGKKMDLIKQRFNDPTYKAYGIVENGILVYSGWISLEKFGMPVKSNFKLKSTEGYSEDDFCHPSFRGRGMYGKMILFKLAKLYEFGKTECLAIVFEGNTSALKAQIKSGARDLGYFYIVKIFGIPFVALDKKKYDGR